LNALIDTNIWSIFIRRKQSQLNPQEKAIRLKLRDIISTGHGSIIGPIRQEVLSGIRDRKQFDEVRTYLAMFEDDPILSADYEEAAACFNSCQRAGVVGSSIDMLICAVALRLGHEIFTTDPDFAHYAQCLPIRLLKI
jgi:predicted nucleic acid-binding protein